MNESNDSLKYLILASADKPYPLSDKNDSKRIVESYVFPVLVAFSFLFSSLLL